MTHTTFDSVTTRIGQLDWPQLVRQLDEHGFAVTDAGAQRRRMRRACGPVRW